MSDHLYHQLFDLHQSHMNLVFISAVQLSALYQLNYLPIPHDLVDWEVFGELFREI